MTSIVSFEESVKLRMKDIIADLIPEERWEGIVKITVAEFERNELPKLIKAELTAMYQKAIAEEFKKPEWQIDFINSRDGVSPAVQKLMVDAAPLILAGLIGGAMQSVTSQFQSYLVNQPRY